jgi:hypothetical protein
MIVNPIADPALGACSTERSTTNGFSERVAGAVIKDLILAPVGASPLIEATYAWQRLRTPRMREPNPSPKPAPLRQQSRVPVVTTQVEEVALRLARLLSSLTWATIRRVEPPAGPVRPALVCVEVPANVYHSVHRGLNVAWRDVQELWNRPTVSEKDLHCAAFGLWRMAMLLDGIGSHWGVISVRVDMRTEASLLARAGDCLGLVPSVDRVRGGFVVVVCGPSQVLRLLRAAGAGDAASAWAR